MWKKSKSEAEKYSEPVDPNSNQQRREVCAERNTRDVRKMTKAQTKEHGDFGQSFPQASKGRSETEEGSRKKKVNAGQAEKLIDSSVMR